MEHDLAYDRIRAAMSTVEAPHGLRERIESERDRTLVRRMVVRRMKLTGVMAGVAALLGVVVGLAASGGGGPTVLEAAVPAASAATGPAPAVQGSHLRQSVDGVDFPRWTGWRPTGQRADEVSGRATRTVFYERGGDRVGYTIVAGSALDWPEGERLTTARGTELRVVRREGRTLVVWREAGRTCIVSAPADVPDARLVDLVDYA